MEIGNMPGYPDCEQGDFHRGFSCGESEQQENKHMKSNTVMNITNSFGSNRDKKRQTTLTLDWLEENYCICPGVCLPRCVLYSHYLDFCTREKLKPTCAATFGKVIRNKFPGLTTRRLGTRGHSKYHYYGLGIRETSPYFRVVYSGRGLTRFSGCKFTNEDGFTRKYCLSTRAGTVLRDFPKAENIILPDILPYDEVARLLSMYKEHCQNIVDAIISNGFRQIQMIMGQFWNNLPANLLQLLHVESIAYAIAMSDVMLYTTLIDVLIPATMEEMPESLLNDIRTLSSHWAHWEAEVIKATPALLQDLKGQTGRRFCRALYRHISFLQVAQTARPILYDVNTVQQMLADTESIDVTDKTDSKSDKPDEGMVHPQVLREMRDLLRGEGTVEGFVDWVDAIMEEKLFRPCEMEGAVFQDRAKTFLLSWSFFGARLLRALTLIKATSFCRNGKINKVTAENHHMTTFNISNDVSRPDDLSTSVKPTGNNASGIHVCRCKLSLEHYFLSHILSQTNLYRHFMMRHQIETFSALLDFCEGNPQVDSPHKASFHALRLLLEEYALLVVESRLHKDAEASLQSVCYKYSHHGEMMPHSVMEMHTVESSLEVNYPVEPPVTVEPIETYETTKQQVDQPYFITETSGVPVLTPPMSPCHQQTEFNGHYLNQPQEGTVPHTSYPTQPPWNPHGQHLLQQMAEYEFTIQHRVTTYSGLECTQIGGHWYPGCDIRYPGCDVRGFPQNNVTPNVNGDQADYHAQQVFPGYPTFSQPCTHVEGRDPLNLLDASGTVEYAACGGMNETDRCQSGNRQTFYVEADINARMRVTCTSARMFDDQDCGVTLP